MFSELQLFQRPAAYDEDHAERIVHITGDLLPRQHVQIIFFHDGVIPVIRQLLQGLVDLLKQGVALGQLKRRLPFQIVLPLYSTGKALAVAAATGRGAEILSGAPGCSPGFFQPAGQLPEQLVG